uniref:PDZ domain-containing protein n=1 Tax=Bursaphelenchus xylophilus TaxID=6326 RepID=A0A1I7SG38_BURXY
ELPSSIGNLNKLRFLDVSSNRLKTVPSTIGNCTALGVLALRSNEIHELPMEIGKLASLRVLDLTFNKLDHLPYTVKVLEGLQALWLSIRQPPMPHLTTIELPNKIKALTCCYLPQNEQNSNQPRTDSKSCVGGARVNFSNNANEATIEDDDSKYPIGNFQRYDTPHPKPFAPKNRANRNSADLTGKTAGTSAESQPNPTESRPLRSVLKKRPISQYAECQLAEERGVLHKIVRDPDGTIGWSIGGGISDHELYKNARGIFVANVRPGGPAERAGIQIDDKIVAVNGTTMSDLNQLDAVRILEEAGAEFEVRIERIPFEAEEPQEKAPVFPQLDAEPRPPSRIGSVLDLNQPIEAKTTQNGTSDPQRAQQKVLELSVDNEPLPAPPKVHLLSTTLPSARSLPSLVEINLFEPNNAPPVPPRRSGSRSNLNPGEFDVQTFLNSLVRKFWRFRGKLIFFFGEKWRVLRDLKSD